MIVKSNIFYKINDYMSIDMAKVEQWDFVNDNVLFKKNISKHLRGTTTKCSNLVWFLGKLDFKLWVEDTAIIWTAKISRKHPMKLNNNNNNNNIQ